MRASQVVSDGDISVVRDVSVTDIRAKSSLRYAVVYRLRESQEYEFLASVLSEEFPL